MQVVREALVCRLNLSHSSWAIRAACCLTEASDTRCIGRASLRSFVSRRSVHAGSAYGTQGKPLS